MSDDNRTQAERDFNNIPKPAKKLKLLPWLEAWLKDQGRSVELYANPMSSADTEWVEERKKGSLAREVRFTVLRATLTGDGKRYFQPVRDAALLESMSQDVLTDLYMQILAERSTFEDLLGKSEATPS